MKPYWQERNEPSRRPDVVIRTRALQTGTLFAVNQWQSESIISGAQKNMPPVEGLSSHNQDLEVDRRRHFPGSREDDKSLEVTVSSRTYHIHPVVTMLVDFATSHARADALELTIPLSEAVANAIIHGNQKNPDKKVIARATVNRSKLIFRIRDQGRGFHFSGLKNPCQPEHLYKAHGRGLFLMFHYMDEIEFNRKGNEVTLKKFVN